MLVQNVPGEPVSSQQVRSVVEGWLQTGNHPLGLALGTEVDSVTEVNDKSSGILLFYLVQLSPEGVVLVAPDDRLEPIIAFMPGNGFVLEERNPAYDLICEDMRSRLINLPEQAVAFQRAAAHNSPTPAEAKWELLEGLKEDTTRLNGLSSVDDERVAPIIETTWNQSDYWDGSQYQACFNYYAPPYGDGVSSNYPCGCVATVFGQLMRHYRYPSAGVGTSAWHIEIDSVDATWNLRGGDDAGGAYDYANMPLSPDGSTTLSQRQAIGRICHDAALVADMNFTAGGSSGYMDSTNLTGVFMFGNAVEGDGDAVDFWHMLNANLDARLPVPMSLTRAAGGHQVLCDGYGFNLGTRYHHLNMGWGGTDNAWYNLPDVDAYYAYTNVSRIMYNIYTNGSGEIISGRVTDQAGSPVSGAVVQAVGDSTTNVVTSDANGIYALHRMASDTTFLLSVSNGSARFVDRFVSTGTSIENGSCGNRWAVDFYEQAPGSNVISGTIALTGGTGVSGVTVTASSGICVTSDAAGYYIFPVPNPWSGSVTYERSGYAITPAQRSYSGLSSNCIAEDATALQLVYVDADAVGTDTGSSWTDAFTNLTDALLFGEGTAVLVAEGTYYPGSLRTDYFRPSEGLVLYGGFAGTETSITQRNTSAHETILSGDIGVPGTATDNSYHVIYGDDNVIIDGFTITGGYADGPSALGGGVNYGGANNIQVVNCILRDNISTDYGGAAYKVKLINCLVYSNTSVYGGCNMWGTNINCTLVDNSASVGSGATYDCRNVNCIIYNNTAGSWGDNYSGGTNLYTCTQPLPSGAGNLSSAPRFVDRAANDYRLASDSPCIDQGDNSVAYGSEDILNNPRIWDGTVDMGAYEAAYLPVIAQTDSNGQVAPTNAQVYRGDSCTFTNSPDTYYHIEDILVNGSSHGATDIFTSSNILIAQTVSVVFAANVVTNVPGNVPEYWLVSYGWTNHFDTAATADQDGDRLLTWQEYVAGTVPTNSASRFIADYTQGSADQVVLSWTPCISNRQYTIAETIDLGQPFTNVAVRFYPVEQFTATVNRAHTYYRVTVEDL
jgi:hypothetical protein